MSKTSYRTSSGQRVVADWHDNGTVTVKTFGLDAGVKSELVTEDQFSNAVVNHGLREIGSGL